MSGAKTAPPGRWWPVLLATLGSCTFGPTVPEGKLTCTSTDQCPDGLVCSPSPGNAALLLCCRKPGCPDISVDRPLDAGLDLAISADGTAALDVPSLDVRSPTPVDLAQDACSGDACSALENGHSCNSNESCASGYCVQGICCDSACTGGCGTCLFPGKFGICSPVESGLLCRPMAGPCDRTESCGGASTECPPDTFTTGIQCRPGSCDGHVATPVAICEVAASCPVMAPRSCSPYTCRGTICLTSCGGHHDCESTHYCRGSTCTPRKPDGAACESPAECRAGVCNTVYRDADGDGHGAGAERLCGVEPAGYVLTSDDDCCDIDERVFRCVGPRNCIRAMARTTPTKCGGFDYDCDGLVTKEPPTYAACSTCGNMSEEGACHGAICGYQPAPACGTDAVPTVCGPNCTPVEQTPIRIACH
jgi:hypothetical protein